MITVMGASGRVGGTVLRALAGSGARLRAISRGQGPVTPGVEWVAADAFDAGGLARAFAGSDAVFVMNPIAPDAADVYADAARLSASVASALRRAGAPYAVALSSQGAHLAERTGVVRTLYEFEQALLGAGVSLTRLRPAYFMESWLPLAEIAAATGQLPALLDPVDRAVPTVSVRDVGRLAAEFLLNPQPGIVNLTGPRAYSDRDAAAILGRLLGTRVTPEPVPADQVASLHEMVGLGASLAQGTAALYAAMNSDRVPFGPADMQRLGQTSLQDVLSVLAPASHAVA